MTGHVNDGQLALYAGGDLTLEDQRAISAHLQGCVPCRAALAELRETQDFVATSLLDPELEDLVQVRERVAAKLQRGRVGERRWAWWLAGAAAAVALLVFTPHARRPIAVTSTVGPVMARSAPAYGPKAALSIEPRHVTRVVWRGPRVRVRAREAGIRELALTARADQTAPILKMTTADPNVVILWQSNERTTDQ